MVHEKKEKVKKYVKEFMLISVGREGINLRVSKFGTFVVAGLVILLFLIGSNIVIREIAQRNRQIERHRKKIDQMTEELRKKDEELNELKEFKKLIDAIKDLSRRVLNKDERAELAKVIYNESEKYKYNWRMIMAVIMTESTFRARLESSDPSYGLMQIKYMTAQEVGTKIGVKVEDKYELYNITKNVVIGGFYLFEQILRFKDVKKGIVAYNLGPTKTAEINKAKKGDKIETDYLKKVLNNYNYLKQRYPVEELN